MQITVPSIPYAIVYFCFSLLHTHTHVRACTSTICLSLAPPSHNRVRAHVRTSLIQPLVNNVILWVLVLPLLHSHVSFIHPSLISPRPEMCLLPFRSASMAHRPWQCVCAIFLCCCGGWHCLGSHPAGSRRCSVCWAGRMVLLPLSITASGHMPPELSLHGKPSAIQLLAAVRGTGICANFDHTRPAPPTRGPGHLHRLQKQ